MSRSKMTTEEVAGYDFAEATVSRSRRLIVASILVGALGAATGVPWSLLAAVAVLATIEGFVGLMCAVASASITSKARERR